MATSAPRPGRSSTWAPQVATSPTTPTCCCWASRWRWSATGWWRVIDSAGRLRPAVSRPLPAWPSPISSRPSRPRWASGPASGPTTWCSDLVEIEHRLGQLKAQGSKGTTGTQASFLEPLPRRPRQGPPAGRADLPQDGLRRKLPGHRPDLSAEDRLAGAGRALRRCPKRHKMATDLRLLASIARRSKSPSRTSRSAPRRWPTSATPCGASGFARWRGSS